jgi:hypothetical protein
LESESIAREADCIGVHFFSYPRSISSHCFAKHDIPTAKQGISDAGNNNQYGGCPSGAASSTEAAYSTARAPKTNDSPAISRNLSFVCLVQTAPLPVQAGIESDQQVT